MDPDEVRAAAGEGAATMLDALDDETVEAIEPFTVELEKFAARLKDRGLVPTQVAQFLVGCCCSVAFRGES